jgi:hypothetical protein
MGLHDDLLKQRLWLELRCREELQFFLLSSSAPSARLPGGGGEEGAGGAGGGNKEKQRYHPRQIYKCCVRALV